MITLFERLVRIKKQEVDIQRLTVSNLEHRLKTINTTIEDIQNQITQESSVIGNNLPLAQSFHTYVETMRKKINYLKEEHQNITLLYQTELSTLESLFADLKTLEIILENKLRDAHHQKASNEQKEWDDKTMMIQNKRKRSE